WRSRGRGFLTNPSGRIQQIWPGTRPRGRSTGGCTRSAPTA
ncbi:MAG: hypothetical protein AVDCRST_MAG88-2488, partial [uncultured Thermomicrobiales bacterium]